MKKTLAILTLVVMLAALIVPVAMAVVETRATCDHPGVHRAETDTRYVSKSSTQHNKNYGYVMRCNACSAELGFEIMQTIAQNHTLSYINKGHGTGTNHNYAKDCTLCNFYGNDVYTCYGPPCAWPF